MALRSCCKRSPKLEPNAIKHSAISDTVQSLAVYLMHYFLDLCFLFSLPLPLNGDADTCSFGKYFSLEYGHSYAGDKLVLEYVA